MFFHKFLWKSMRAQMEYPASFIMLLISHLFSSSVYFLSMWILFDRFKMVQGWTFSEACVIYGIIHTGFGFADCFAKGFEKFSQTLLRGDFERILLRPMSPLVQVAMQEVQVFRLARSFQGLLALFWGLGHLALTKSIAFYWVIPFAIIGTTALFYGLFVIQAALSFWTVETLEIMHIATYGGVQSAQYPISIYSRPFRVIFTTIIPLACVVYYPVAGLFSHEQIPPFFILFLPVVGFVFLVCAIQFWRFGVRRFVFKGC